MTTAQWLGLVISVWGAAGMYVAGKGAWKGWAMGLAAQPIWLVFALVVHSWPLAFSPLLYGTVYAKNLWRWKHDKPVKTVRYAAVKIVKDQPVPDMRRRDRRALERARAKR